MLNSGTASVTLDESAGLQNATATPTATPVEDGNDNDILVNKTTYAGLPADFVAALPAGTILDAAVSGHNGASGDTGTDAFTLTNEDVIGLSFSNASGGALNGEDSGLDTLSGQNILLYTGSNNNVLYGRVPGATPSDPPTLVFAAYLEETGTPDAKGAKIWMVQYLPIKSPNTASHDEALDLAGKVWVGIAQQTHFDFSNAPSGQNLFLIVGNATEGIVVTGKDPADQSAGESITTGDTINTSKGGGSTTIGNTNQMVDPGEGVNLTYVTSPVLNYTIPNLTQGEADVESNIQYGGLKSDVLGGAFDISQLQKGKTASIKITAENTNATPGAGFIRPDIVDTSVAISSVAVMMGGTPVTTGITITPSGNSFIIDGIKAGHTIEYHTNVAHTRLLIENVPNGPHQASFDIGGVTIIGSTTDTAQIGQLIRFEDAGPAIAQGVPVDTADVNTQDAETKGTDTSTDTQSFAAAFTIGSSTYDTDGAGTTTWQYGFSLPNAGADSGMNSHGANIYLHLIAGNVVGSTAASALDVGTTNTIFDLAVDSAGVVTMNQYFQIDHATPGVGTNFAAQQEILANGLINLDATVTILDADGDSASATKSIDLGGNLKFDDDGPGTFSPTSVTILNSGSAVSPATALNSDGTEGADVNGTVKFVDNYVADDLLRDADGNLLTSGDKNIVLTGFGTTQLTATQVGTGGQVVFVATIDNATDTYSIDYNLPIDDGGGISFLGAAPVKSGNPRYNILDNVGGTTMDVLFSGGDTGDPDPSDHTVNVSTTGAGTDNQSMNATAGVGDLLRMDFRVGATLAGSPNGSDFNYGSLTATPVNGFSFLLSQNTPSGTAGTAYIRVYDDTDNDKNLTDGVVDSDITSVSVNGLVLYDGTTFTSRTINGQTVSAMLFNDGIVITGLSEGQTGDGTGGDDPVIKISTADGFNRVEVANFSGQTVGGNVLGGGDFDIAPAGVDVGVEGDPFSFNLAVRNYDFDEDFSPIALIGVNMTPVPVP